MARSFPEQESLSIAKVENLALAKVDHLSFPNFLSILKRRAALMASVFVSVLALAALITFLMPKQYESTMKFLVKNDRSNMIVSPGTTSAGSSPDVSDAEVNSEMELLNSADVLDVVVVKCGLQNKRGLPDTATGHAIARERGRAMLERHLSIRQLRKTDIIQVTCKAPSPELAANVLNRLSDAFLDAHLALHAAPGTLAFFQTQASEYERQLRDAEVKLRDFREGHADSLGEQRDLLAHRYWETESQLQSTSTEIAQRLSTESRQQALLSSAAPRISTQSRSIPNQYSVERLHTLLTELTNKRTEMAANFRADDRMVTELDAEIQNTRKALDEANRLTAVEQTSDVNPLHQSLEVDKARETTLLAGLTRRRQDLVSDTAKYKERLSELEHVTAAEDNLQRRVKEAEADYLVFKNKAEEARINELLDRQKISNVAIEEHPTITHKAVSPNVGLNLGLGAVLGLFLALGSAFTAEWATPPAALHEQPFSNAVAA